MVYNDGMTYNDVVGVSISIYVVLKSHHYCCILRDFY